MDDILKSEVFIAVYEKKEGISLEQFAGLFHQVHGYQFKLSNYGYSSLKKLLNDMKDLVDVKTVNGKDIVRCKSPSRHHVEVSIGNNSSQAQEQISGLSSVPMLSSGSSPGPVVTKHKPAQRTPYQQNPVKQVNSRNFAIGIKSKEASKSKYSPLDKNIAPSVSHMKRPQPIKCGSAKKTASINKTTTICTNKKTQRFPAILNPPTSSTVHTRPARHIAIAACSASNVSKPRRQSNSESSNSRSARNLTFTENVRLPNTTVIENKVFSAITVSGVQPNMSYASVCANKIQPNHNGQQYTPNNISFNVGTKVNSTGVTQTYSRAEPKTSVQTSSAIKENIQLLLNQHTDGLSVFQLQKLYLFMFQQPLKCKGLTTVKQLLLALRDVVKIQGVGVQMLVYPVHGENNATTAADQHHDSSRKGTCTLFINKDFQKEVVLNPHYTDSLKTQEYTLQEAAQSALRDEQILTSGQQQMGSMERKFMKIMVKPPTLQNMQNVQNIPFNADYAEYFSKDLSVPASNARLLPKHINEKPQHVVPPSAQVHHQMYKTHGHEEFSDLCKNVIPKETAKNGPSQNAPTDSSFPQLILYSSEFSFVMKQPINGSQNMASEMDLADTTSSLTEQKLPYHSNNMFKGPEHLSNANSSMISPNKKTHQISILHAESIEHLQEHRLVNTMQTYGHTEFPALQPKLDLQTAKNCNVRKPSHLGDSLQTKTVQIEKPPSIQKTNSQNTEKVEKATYSTSQEKATNSQDINNGDNFLNVLPNEKTPDVQATNVVEKTSQQEVSVSPCSNGRGEVHDLYVHDGEQATPLSSDVHRAVKMCTRKRKQNKSTLLTEQLDEFTTAEAISQSSLLSLRQRQEIVTPPQNITEQPKISVPLGELQNSSENRSEQEDMRTWQTSQGQVCCIL